MALQTTPAYITIVNPNRTIELPSDMPIGTTVAVIVMPSEETEREEEARHARFAAPLAAIRAASEDETWQNTLSDTEIEALVEKARKHC